MNNKEIIRFQCDQMRNSIPQPTAEEAAMERVRIATERFDKALRRFQVAMWLFGVSLVLFWGVLIWRMFRH